MGKRQRRRDRASGREDTRQGPLGAPGPYTVCGVCNQALNQHHNGDEVIYLHSAEFVNTDGRITAVTPVDHIAVPVPGTPLTASLLCDFCHAPDPRYAFVPRRPVQVPNPVTGAQMDYSSPWSCCAGCLQAVRSRNITRMLDRAFASPHGTLGDVPPAVHHVYRAPLRRLYSEYLKSDPAGPYEVRIKPDHKPIGKPGSRRGM